MKNSINIKIGGNAGEGIKISGLTLSRCLTRLGYSIFSYPEYPSLIRGGHNSYQIHAGVEKVYSQIKKIDLLIALNQETITLHQDELENDSLVFYDPGEFKLPKGRLVGKYIPIEFIKLALKVGGKSIMANMVSLGSVLAIFGLSLKPLYEMIADSFEDKGAEVIKLNQKAADAGKKFIDDNCRKDHAKIAKPTKIKKRMVLTGNEAVALGAIAGGLKLYSAYPMTPSTSILHYLARVHKKANIVVKHAEDEISAINMALGASFAGARAMTGTSGGGLSLMGEAISFAGISETPLVIVNSQRPGPALGMPTWTAQSDLQLALNIGHDDFPRIVLAPGDAQEAFLLTKQAMNLAEEYQLPVFVLIDKYLSESDYSCQVLTGVHQNNRLNIDQVPKNGKNDFYKRYKLGDNPVSKRTLPGTNNGIYLSNSYEHDEFGLGTENAQVRKQMMQKRMAKLKLIEKDIVKQSVYGNEQAKIGLISWGSNKGPILEALKLSKNLKFLHINWLWPFPANQVKQFIEGVDKCFCLECNARGQLGSLIKEQTSKEVVKILKFDGRPFWPEEICSILR
jgi:2-oxoglutarate ferredoxin oxidoreductase subunit alpha